MSATETQRERVKVQYNNIVVTIFLNFKFLKTKGGVKTYLTHTLGDFTK